MQISRSPLSHVRILLNIQRLVQKCVIRASYSTPADVIDIYPSDLLQRHGAKTKTSHFVVKDLNIRYFTETENNDVSKMSPEQLEALLVHLSTKNKDKQIENVVSDCLDYRIFISHDTFKKLLRKFSASGKPESVILMQQYCSKVNPNLYKRNGEFLHYLAKAQCMKGNSEKGLFVLKEAYRKYVNLRNLYRAILKELIHDSVLNRSEASLVIFKKYVLSFSDTWQDHYPLVCFWHICWSSSWFSDQMLSDELLEASISLQDIVKDKATAFSICILRDEYNEDAVMRLLQALLKYDMMTEYTKVLQILFNYKLRNRDMRGCAEIIRNCETLGVSLPSDQQGKYIKMLIEGKPPPKQPTDKHPKDFKLKF